EAKAEIAAISARIAAPPAPRDPAGQAKCAEVRERLAALSRERRAEIIRQAIEHDDDLVPAAVLNSAGWVSGLGFAEPQLVRHNGAAKHSSADLDRRERLAAAIEATMRAGSAALTAVDELTDPVLVAKAEAAEKQAMEALAAIKN